LRKLAIQMKEKTDGVKRRKYDASFREEVVKMVLNGRPVGEVAQSLGIGENLVYRWKSRYGPDQPTALEKADHSAVVSQDQQFLLKRIRELETERDILKKALAIFSRQT
jgi:transposase